MLHTEHRRGITTRIETKACDLPSDELAHLQEPLDQVADVVGDLPAALKVTITHHARSDQYHAEAALKLPRRSLITGKWDHYLDTAAQHCLQELVNKVEDYLRDPDRAVDAVAERVEAMNRQVVAPENPDEGAVGRAVRAQDYQRFRELLAGFENWLRLRVGRWLQRYPEVEAGRRLSVGDLVEEVFLSAYIQFRERPGPVPLSQWLEDLIDPVLRSLWRDPVGEGENVNQARTLRETRLS